MPGLEDVRILTGLTDPDAMLDFYLRLGCRVVVLKMGESGAFLGTRDMRVRTLHTRFGRWTRQGRGIRSAVPFWPESWLAMRRRRRHAMQAWLPR